MISDIKYKIKNTLIFLITILFYYFPYSTVERMAVCVCVVGFLLVIENTK